MSTLRAHFPLNLWLLAGLPMAVIANALEIHLVLEYGAAFAELLT
jgi:hypothetical protein